MPGTPSPFRIDPVELYAAAIDTSDYVASVAPLVRARLPVIGDLLDIGAGGGQLGDALRSPSARWTAIEPNENMRARLARFPSAPDVVAAGWETAEITSHRYDTVIAANMPGPLYRPEEFLACCREWSRGTVVWVVPAQNGPRGLCLAGCLPREWHGEDETPGIEVVLRGLTPANVPRNIAFADWTFTAISADLHVTGNYLASRLGWPEDDGRRADLVAHLVSQARPDPAGHRLEIVRKSAVMIWSL